MFSAVSRYLRGPQTSVSPARAPRRPEGHRNQLRDARLHQEGQGSGNFGEIETNHAKNATCKQKSQNLHFTACL